MKPISSRAVGSPERFSRIAPSCSSPVSCVAVVEGSDLALEFARPDDHPGDLFGRDVELGHVDSPKKGRSGLADGERREPRAHSCANTSRNIASVNTPVFVL